MSGIGEVWFDFTYKNWKEESLLLNLGKTILELEKSIPGGILVFFPCYSVLKDTVKVW